MTTVNQLQEYLDLLDELARRKRISECEQDIMKFATTYFSDRIVTTDPAPFHHEMMNAIKHTLDQPTSEFLAIAAPRGHAKSMLSTVITTLWTICYKKYNYVLFISKTQEISKQLLAIVKNELSINEQLIADFGDLTDKGTWNLSEIICKNGVKVQSAGSGDGLRGLNHLGSRPGLILLDDLEKDFEVESAVYRDQMWEWLNSTAIPLGQPNKCKIIYVGTILHEDSVLNRVMKKDGRFKPLHYSAIVSWPKNMGVWHKWAEMRNERVLSADDEVDSAYQAAQEAYKFYEENRAAMHEGCEVLWPEQMPLYKLMEIWSTNRKSFLTEYLNQPRDETTSVFTSFRFYDDLPPLTECKLFGALDPSIAKTKRADPSAIVTIAKHTKSGLLFVVDVNVKRRSPDQIIEDVLRLANTYDYSEFAIESVQFQEFLATQIQQRALLAGIYVPMISVKPTTDKVLRISSLEPLVSTGMLRFAKNHMSLVDELKDFPSGQHDDMADALEMCVSLATNKKRRQFVFSAV